MTASPLATSSDRSRTGAWWTLLIALILIAAVSRLSHFLRPFEGDGSVFIYMGRVISEGGRWGEDIVDNKFPTVGLMFSGCWRAFGAYWPAYVVLGAAMSAGATLALARAARRNFDRDGGDATLMFALAYLNFSLIVWILGGFQLETLLTFFTSLGALAALEALRKGDARDAFTLGLCAGTAALIKPTGLSVGAAFGIALLFGSGSWRRFFGNSIAAALGVAIPLGVALAYLIGTDTLQQIPLVYREISKYAANSAWDWRSDFGKPIIVLFIAGFPMLVRGWISRRARTDAGARQASMLVFVLVWLALETFGVVAQRRMYGYHFLVMVPPLALLFGFLPRRATAGSMFAALLPVAGLSVFGVFLMLRPTVFVPPALPVSEYLKTHAKPGDAVWSDNAARVLLETGLRPGSRCVLTFLFANSDESPLHYSDMIVGDFEARRPRFVVLNNDMPKYVKYQAENILEFIRFPQRQANFYEGWRRIDAYVHEHYEPVARVGDECVWQRRITGYQPVPSTQTRTGSP